MRLRQGSSVPQRRAKREYARRRAFRLRPPPTASDAPPLNAPMADHIRDRINRKLATLGEERLYQVLDYVEFLELRYGQPARDPSPVNPLQRFADGIEDRLRAGGVAASTVSEAMGFLNKAVGVLGDVATAGRNVAADLANAAQGAAQRAAESPPGQPRPAGPASGTAPAQGPTDPTDMPSYPSPT